MRLPPLPYTVGVALLLAWGGFLSAVMLGTLFTYLPAGDFGAFYSSAESFWAVRSLYTPHPYLNLNPPHASVLLFSPLVLVDVRTAAAAWTAMNLTAVALSLGVIASELRLSATRLVAVVAVLVASAPFHASLNGGQMGGLLMLLVTLAWRAQRQGQWSVWLAVATSIKPWLAPLILFQKPRQAAATIALGLSGLALGVLVLGLGEWLAWLTVLERYSERPMPGNASLLSALLMLAEGTVVSAESARIVWAVLGIVLVGLTVSRRGDTDGDWLLAGLVGVLVSPLGWTYYLLALVAPLVGWGEKHGWPVPAIGCLAVLLVPTQILIDAQAAGLTALGAAYTGALLMLWALALRTEEQVAAAAVVTVPTAGSR